VSAPQLSRARGRPRASEAPVSAPEILDAALRAFARYGYDGMSVRTLTRELGLTHNAIPQRFGTKEQLWHTAVDHDFGGLTSVLVADNELTNNATGAPDPLKQLRGVIVRFLHHSAAHPELLSVMNTESGQDTDRLNYIYDNYVGPASAPLAALLDRLAGEGRIRPTPLRTLHFLITSGGAAPFSMVALARRLGPGDPLDPAAVTAHAALVADLIVAGQAVRPDHSA
jgi:AcrR family transcriptional regulator